ncbi:hypothetical protein pdam_00016110 [Pocillopora damicornis]|uniref:Uncharacterized protein n=1 Tax=Pocillopora damicornis TaxID=46731 RepID=A0A3M6UBK8_POCDA|nr:hypothetical protein pdam_00016110 [Pocillopora damicornis]
METVVDELLKIKHELTKERDEKLSEIKTFKSRVIKPSERLEKEKEFKKESSQAKSDLENRTTELRTKAGNLQSAQEDITKLDQQLKEQRVNLLRIMNEKAMEYTDVLNARFNKVLQDFNQQLLSIDRLATENT